MLNKFTLFITVALIVGSITANAQMSKDQKKAVKQQLGEYKKNPESYQAMLDSYKKKIDKLEKEVKETEQILKECRVRQIELEDSLTMLSSMVRATPAPSMEDNSSDGGGSGESVTDQMPSNGPAFSVQLGYYEAFNITEYFKSAKIFTFENTGKGNRYVVRYFTDKGEADRFAQDIRAMGIKDAFVANYLNGKRVTEEEMKTFLKNPGTGK